MHAHRSPQCDDLFERTGRPLAGLLTKLLRCELACNHLIPEALDNATEIGPTTVPDRRLEGSVGNAIEERLVVGRWRRSEEGINSSLIAARRDICT